MDREELVQQILKQVLAKLTDMGEKADAACVRPDAVCPAAHKPGLLILTQEHGVDCHAKLEDPRLQERYGTQCALMADYAVDIADVEVVILYQLSIEALCKLSSGLCRHSVHQTCPTGDSVWKTNLRSDAGGRTPAKQHHARPPIALCFRKSWSCWRPAACVSARSRHSWTRSWHGGCAAASVDAPCACPAPAAGQAVRLEKRSLPNGTS